MDLSKSCISSLLVQTPGLDWSLNRDFPLAESLCCLVDNASYQQASFLSCLFIIDCENSKARGLRTLWTALFR